MTRIDFKTGTFYLGDCFDVMATLAPGCVDMVLCDLPYGTTQNKWDSVLPLDRLWADYWRLLKANGPAVLTAQCPFDKILGYSQIRYLKYEWQWIKSSASGFLNAKKAPLKNTENALVFYRAQPTYEPQMRVGFKPYKSRQGIRSSNYGAMDENHMSESSGERYPLSTLEFNNERGLHPTQKPVALFEYLIRTYTNPGELVLDNTAGSGTTAIAAIQSGRRWICIERDPGYFEKAIARVWDAEAAL
jgi:site-specific DNA-methyltransferase (adenine-specific)